MAAFSRFSEDVSEEELNALFQKVIPEKTNSKKIWYEKFQRYKKNEFEVSTGQFHSTNSRWCIISIGCFNEFSNCLTKKYRST